MTYANFFFLGGVYVFLNPPALPEVPEALFNVRQTYSLSSLAFKRVTHRSAITNKFPLPFPVLLTFILKRSGLYHRRLVNGMDLPF